MIADAERERFDKVQAAEGAASRFGSLLSVYRDNATLTSMRLYWRAIEQALSSRPLTIIDPKAAGRRHLFLADPAELKALGTLNSATPINGAPAKAVPAVPNVPDVEETEQ
jgi:hypothetical protein